MNHDSLETRIGSRWLLYVGIAAIVIGVAYFEKLAFVSAPPHAIQRRGTRGFAAMRARAAT